MNRLKPLALSLSLLFTAIPAAHAAVVISPMSIGGDDGVAAGLDMMRQNADQLINGDNVWDRVRQGFQLSEVNPDLVARQERYYATHPAMFKRIVDRSHKYMFYVLNEVERRGMPTEIALLPMVESAFVPNAISPVGASGLWQFMPETGRRYGLEQTWWYDGRRDVTVSTNAALDYLQTLYAQFGDWSLALAAYNWGEGNVVRSMARAQAAGLEPTFENIKMPAETRNYVPKLLAVRNLLATPENFGMHLDKFPDKPYFVAVNPERHMDISLAAQLAGISVSEFMDLNPAFNMPVYAYKAGRAMLLPADRVDSFQSNLAHWDKPLLTWQVYTPTTPESVTDVANRVGMSSAQLMSVNHMNNMTLSPGRPVLIAMRSSDGDVSNMASTDTSVSVATPVTEIASNSGAGLQSAPPLPIASIAPAELDPIATVATAPQPAIPVVARPFAAPTPAPVTVAANTPNDVGMTASADAPAPAPILIAREASSNNDTPAPFKVAMVDQPVPQMVQAAASQHTVAPGDTLYNISHRANLTVSELKALNNLHGNTVKIGQVLLLKPTAVAQIAQQSSTAAEANPSQPVPGVYVVQHGDTVYSIARRFGIDRALLQQLNDGKMLTHLHPGQVIKLQSL